MRLSFPVQESATYQCSIFHFRCSRPSKNIWMSPQYSRRTLSGRSHRTSCSTHRRPGRTVRFHGNRLCTDTRASLLCWCSAHARGSGADRSCTRPHRNIGSRCRGNLSRTSSCRSPPCWYSWRDGHSCAWQRCTHPRHHSVYRSHGNLSRTSSCRNPLCWCSWHGDDTCWRQSNIRQRQRNSRLTHFQCSPRDTRTCTNPRRSRTGPWRHSHVTLQRTRQRLHTKSRCHGSRRDRRIGVSRACWCRGRSRDTCLGSPQGTRSGQYTRWFRLHGNHLGSGRWRSPACWCSRPIRGIAASTSCIHSRLCGGIRDIFAEG